MLHPLAPWLIAIALVAALGVLQWRVMHSLQLRRLAADCWALWCLARQQTAQVQQELAAVREAAKLGQTTARARAAAGNAVARQRLNEMLDDAPMAELPKDGFADTLPSRHFAPSTTFGLLQRSGSRAM